MINFLNKLITKYNDKKWTKKDHRILEPKTSGIINNLESQIIICNIRAAPSNWISKLIGKFSTYKEYGKSAPLSHTICIFNGDIEKLLEGHPIYKSILQGKIYKYYKNPPLLKEMKSIVLCSADDNGMNYFDFSAYQNRDYSLRPILNLDYNKTRSIVKAFISEHNKPYDYTGLIFWPLYKIFKFLRIFDDSKSWFCSEVTEKILRKHGVRVSKKDNPSPADIEYANKYYFKKYRTEGFLR